MSLAMRATGGMSTVLKETAPATLPASCDLLYQDSLNRQDWSWDGVYHFSDTGQVYAGSFSIEATIAQVGGRLSLRRNSDIPGHSYASIGFWIHGRSSGVRQLQVTVQTMDSGGENDRLSC